MKTRIPTLRYTITIGPREDLGTRKPMIAALTARMRRERARAAARWIDNPARLRRKRAGLLARVAYNPRPVPFCSRVVRTEAFPGYLRKTLSLQINPDDRTGAYLYLPRHASPRNRVPALLGLHEHGGQWLLGGAKLAQIEGMPKAFRDYQDRCYGGQPPADYFAANGFAVLAIDQFGFGSRALWRTGEPPYHNGRTPISPAQDLQLRLRMRHEHFWLHRALLVHGVTEAEISLYDNRRSIDFLESIPEIDPDRIGAFGLSVGSMWTHHIAALDERVKAAAPVCWSGDYGDMLERDGARVLGVHFLLPGVNAECHIPEFVALTHPRAMLIINGTQDTMYTLDNQKRTRREVLKVARLQKRQDRLRWHFFEGPHCFHPPAQQLALEFFREFLR